MIRQAQRAARKAYTEAAFENIDRTRYKLGGCGAVKKAARRADRRLGKAICKEWI